MANICLQFVCRFQCICDCEILVNQIQDPLEVFDEVPSLAYFGWVCFSCHLATIILLQECPKMADCVSFWWNKERGLFLDQSLHFDCQYNTSYLLFWFLSSQYITQKHHINKLAIEGKMHVITSTSMLQVLIVASCVKHKGNLILCNIWYSNYVSLVLRFCLWCFVCIFCGCWRLQLKMNFVWDWTAVDMCLKDETWFILLSIQPTFVWKLLSGYWETH